jgi:hypothetical protein
VFGEKQKPTREELLREAGESYDRVFGQQEDTLGERHQPLTFSEIEEQAVQEGNKLARWIVEAKISTEAEKSGCRGENCPCPHCGRPAKQKREDSDRREVRARPGAVSFERHEYYCCFCRRSFFPSGRPAGSQG